MQVEVEEGKGKKMTLPKEGQQVEESEAEESSSDTSSEGGKEEGQQVIVQPLGVMMEGENKNKTATTAAPAAAAAPDQSQHKDDCDGSSSDDSDTTSEGSTEDEKETGTAANPHRQTKVRRKMRPRSPQKMTVTPQVMGMKGMNSRFWQRRQVFQVTMPQRMMTKNQYVRKMSQAKERRKTKLGQILFQIQRHQNPHAKKNLRLKNNMNNPHQSTCCQNSTAQRPSLIAMAMTLAVMIAAQKATAVMATAMMTTQGHQQLTMTTLLKEHKMLKWLPMQLLLTLRMMWI